MNGKYDPAIEDAKLMKETEPFMLTYTGRKVWPLQMKPDDIHILDIAHALSNNCRYNGHVSRFYSVAEHCVLLARSKFPGMPRWKLMHDAAEAYIPDVSRPFKAMLPNLIEAEKHIMEAIAERFDLPPYEGEIEGQVKVGDTAMLYWEGNALMQHVAGCCWVEMEKPEVEVDIQSWAPIVAEVEFISEFRKLFNRKEAPADE